MNKKAFSVFSKRVVGCEIEESFLNDFNSFEIIHSPDEVSIGITSDLVLKSNSNNNFKSRVNQNSLIYRKIKEKYDDFYFCLEILDSSEREERTQEIINRISEIFDVDYGLENVFKEKIYDRFFNVKYLCNSFSALLDLSIRLHSENKLRDLIVNNLQEILGDSDFINLPENVRLAQQILSVNPSYALLDKLASLSVNVSLNQIDAVISLALSISETEIDFISFVEKYELETCNFDISELYLFSETLARSPVKANFLSSDFFIRNFWDRLKEDFNYQLLFRCIFFIEENKLNVIKHVDIVKLLHRVISSREKTFVNLYRDVRRSRRIICTEAEVRGLLKTLNLANLSTNKLIFLFSILEPYTAEQEKMLFLSRVMVSKGLPRCH